MHEVEDTDVNDSLEHGRPSTYNNHKCRCGDCRKAWAKYIRDKGYVRAYQQRQRDKKLQTIGG